MFALLGLGVDIKGIDLDVPVLRGRINEFLLIYKKNGFVAFDQHIFKLGTDDQTDLLMRLELEMII
jgi:hypothetical protein